MSVTERIWLYASGFIVLGCCTGWCMNLYKILHPADGNVMTTIFRLASAIIFPIGCVIGWF